MPLRRKVSLLLAAGCALHLGAVFMISRHVLLPRLFELQRSEAVKDMERCVEAISREIHHLSLLCQDWAAWDDTYRFIVDKNENYVSSTLGPEVFANNHLALVCYCDRAGRFVWKKTINAAGEPIIIPPFDGTALPVGHPLLNLPKKDSEVQSIIDTPEGPLMVTARPIVMSDNSGEIRGALIMGRLLNDKALAGIGEQTRLKLSSWTTSGRGSRPIPPELQEVFHRCVHGEAVVDPQSDRQGLLVHAVLKDIDGNALVLLRAHVPDDISAEGRAAVRFAGWSNVTAVLLLAALIWFSLEATVIKPLRTLSVYAAQPDPAIRVEACPLQDRGDEIGTLSTAFDRMVQRLAEALSVSNTVRGEQARTLSLLLDYSNQLACADDTPTILDHTIAATCELTGCRRVSIMLPAPGDPETLTIAGSVGIGPHIVRNVRVPIGSPIAGLIYARKTKLICNTKDEAEQYARRSDRRFFRKAPLISHALVSGEQVVGVLNLTDRSVDQPFSPADIDNVATICNMAGTAINNIKARRCRDEAYHSVVRALARLVECRDSNTGHHLDRVTAYSLLLAQTLRRTGVEAIDDVFLAYLRLAVPLHDIGKVGIPDAILCKPGRLTPEEIAVMQEHAAIGGSALAGMVGQAGDAHFLSMAADIALHHHERWDGRGYPNRLADTAIPLAARIVAVADVYDALTSRRPYKEPFTHVQSRKIVLEGGGAQFDPQVVQAFAACEEEFRLLAEQLADDAHANGYESVEHIAELV